MDKKYIKILSLLITIFGLPFTYILCCSIYVICTKTIINEIPTSYLHISSFGKGCILTLFLGCGLFLVFVILREFYNKIYEILYRKL